MLIGYMRVSTDADRQVMDLQRDALLAVGVDERHLHQDKASGARDDRPARGEPRAETLERTGTSRCERALSTSDGGREGSTCS